MQAYGPSFARVYNQKWVAFVQRTAPWLRFFYESMPIGQQNRALLDLCCGTGQLAFYFLEHGYTVTGVDLSEHMLHWARENNVQHVETGQAHFIQADVSDLAVDGQFGLVVSTFDALNHLPDQDALASCFRCVYPVLVPDGWFIFDLNTRGSLQRWNNISIEDDPEFMIVNRGLYDGQGDKAWIHVSGFMRYQGGQDGSPPLYERFQETVYNTIFDLQWVQQALREIGWSQVYCARITDLHTPIEEPEKENRAFVMAQK